MVVLILALDLSTGNYYFQHVFATSDTQLDGDALESDKFQRICSETPLCECDWTLRSISCVGNGPNLTFIPRIPRGIKNITFVRNDLVNIDNDTLANLRSNYSVVDLSRNNITNVSEGAFLSLKFVVRIYLNKNAKLSLAMFEKGFRGQDYIHIQSISLRGLGWTTISNQTFSKRWIALRYLDVSNNKLQTFASITLRSISRSLTYLFIGNNHLHTVQLERFKSLQILYLDHNRLRKIPNFCDGTNSKTPKLGNLNLANNFISNFSSDSYNCLPSLFYLRLDANSPRTIANGTFSSLGKLNTLSLMNLASGTLSQIEGSPFASRTLQKLYFAFNKFHFKPHTYDAKKIFKGLRNLAELEFSGNYLPQDNGTVIKILSPLENVKTLILTKIAWTMIPMGVFSKLKKLNKLVLNNNNIYTWDAANPFHKMTSLTYLGLYHNAIKYINKTSFPKEFLATVKRIDLSQNPFYCTCDLMWFRDFLKTTTISFKPYPASYICSYPNKHLHLEDYHPTVESCTPRDPYLVLYIALPSSALFIICTVIAVYKGRWHIRYWIYLLRTKRNGYTRLSGDEDFVFDAFVIYCEADMDWVHHTLLGTLENREGYRLCIHKRDFDIGNLIVDNIDKNLYLSRKVIVVLSNNFSKSEWCEFELALAQRRYLKEGIDVMIVVLLEKLQNKNVTSVIKSLVTTVTYAEWSEEDNSTCQQVFWGHVLGAMRRP